MPDAPPPICEACGHTNPPGSRFCNGCGTALEAAPTARRAERRAPKEYTPKHLAERILTQRTALEGERKQVTILFADVQGSTALAQELDPEEWHVLLDRFFQILADGVHRFEGTVNQFAGDGIMALFGAPLAHEDHAERACHAALALRDDLARYTAEVKRRRGLAFAVRMGLASGEVVVGKIGDDLRMDYTAQGVVANLAARLQALADPGEAYVADSTARLAEGFFELRELGEFEIRGLRAPERVRALMGPGPLRTRFDRARARGLSRFVGRAAELEQLEAALARALRGELVLVGIVAPAGTGKTRLAFEFAERCRAGGLRVYFATTPPFGRELPLHQVLDLQRQRFDIREDDPPATRRDKLAGRLYHLGLVDDLPIWLSYFGLDDGPPVGSVEQRKAALSRFTRANAELKATPAIIVRDDLQWLDDASLSMIEELVRGSRSGPAAGGDLAIYTYRPDFRPPWIDQIDLELRLETLDADVAHVLLADLLGPEAASHPLADRIAARCAGNPFFLEETVRALAESGGLEGTPGRYRVADRAEEALVPESVQTALSARIDCLSDPARALLQAAAVVGRAISVDALARVSGLPRPEVDAGVAELLRGELLRRESPRQQLGFVHPLVQEVAYASQLRGPRQKLHVRAAAAVQEGPAERADEDASLVAYHLERGGATPDAARWHARAARWLESRELAAALTHWESVRRLARETEGEEGADRLRLEACTGVVQLSGLTGIGEPVEAFDEGRRLARKLDDSSTSIALGAAWSGRLTILGRLREAAELLDATVDEARASGQMRELAELVGRGTGHLLAHGILGLLQEGIALLEELRTTGAENPNLDVARAWMALRRGALREATQEFQRLREVARERNEIYGGFFVELVAAEAAELAGDPHAAEACAARGEERASQLGDAPRLRRGVAIMRADAHILAGRFHAGLEAALAGLRVQQFESFVAEVRLRTVAARAILRLGRLDEALEQADRGVAVAEEAGMRPFGISALGVRTEALLDSPRPEALADAETTIARAFHLMDETGDESHRARFQELSARLAGRRGNRALWRDTLRAARASYATLGAPLHVARLDAELAAGPSVT